MRVNLLFILVSSALLSSGSNGSTTHFNDSAHVPSISDHQHGITLKRLLRAHEMTNDEDRMLSLEDAAKIVEIFVERQKQTLTRADEFVAESLVHVQVPASQSASARNIGASNPHPSSPATKGESSRPKGKTPMELLESLSGKLSHSEPDTLPPTRGKRSPRPAALTKGESATVARLEKLNKKMINDEQLLKLTDADAFITGNHFVDMLNVFTSANRENEVFGALNSFFGEDILASVLRDVENGEFIPSSLLKRLKKLRLDYWEQENKSYGAALKILRSFENENDEVNNIYPNASDLEDYIERKLQKTDKDRTLIETLIDGYTNEKLAEILSKAERNRYWDTMYFSYLKKKDMTLADFFEMLKMKSEGIQMFIGKKFTFLKAYALFLHRLQAEQNIMNVYIAALETSQFGHLLSKTIADSSSIGKRQPLKYIMQVYFRSFIKDDSTFAAVLKTIEEKKDTKAAEVLKEEWARYKVHGFDKQLPRAFSSDVL